MKAIKRPYFFPYDNAVNTLIDMFGVAPYDRYRDLFQPNRELVIAFIIKEEMKGL